MDIQPVISHRKEFTFIGLSTVIRRDEGFIKCLDFWNEQYTKRFECLLRTMMTETPEERAVFDNCIGQYAVCRSLKKRGLDAFVCMACGEYKGGFFPRTCVPHARKKKQYKT